MFNISSLFSAGIIVSPTGACFSILSSFDLVNASAILFSINSRALWTTFLEDHCFLCFLANDKNTYPLTYFLVLGSIEYRCISIY